MKYCEEFAALLDPYVDGELSGAEALRVRDHLEDCPGCRSYVDAALAIRAALPDAEEAEVPEGFAEGVMARVRELEAGKKPGRRRRTAGWRAVLLPLAACFALVVLVRTMPGGGGERALDSAAPANITAADTPAEAAMDAEDEAYTFSATAPETADGVPAEADFAPEPRAILEQPAPEPAAAPESPVAPDGLSAAPEEPGAQPEQDAVTAHTAGKQAGGRGRAIRLTEEEAGDLLADLPCTEEEDGSRRYQLDPASFDALLEALAERGITPPEAEVPEEDHPAEAWDLVYVTEE